MKCVVIYGTVEGHTRKIANRISERLISKGDDVVVDDAATITSEFSIADCDACIIAASVYNRQYPESISRLIHSRVTELNAIPTAFVSVGLAMAIEDGHVEAQTYIDTFLSDTGWTPRLTHNAAGAVRYKEYDYFQEQIVRYIVMKDRPGISLTGDHEFTDWEALDQFVDSFRSII